MAVALGLVGAEPAAAQRLLHAGAFWAAFERPGGLCEAVSRSELIAAPGRPQARATFAFTRDGKRRGELHFLFARPVRPGAAAVLTVGSRELSPRHARGQRLEPWSGPGSRDHRRHPPQHRNAGPRAGPGRADQRSLSARRCAHRDRCRGARLLNVARRPGEAGTPGDDALSRGSGLRRDDAVLENSAKLATWPLSHERRHQPYADPRSGRSCHRPASRGGHRRSSRRADRPHPRRHPRGAGRRRHGCAPGQAALEAAVALDVQSRGHRFRADDRHRQGPAAVAGRAVQDHPARSGRGAGVVRRHPQVAAAHPRRARLRDGVHPRRRPRHPVRVEPGRLHARTAVSATPARCAWCAISISTRSSAR